MLDEEKEAMIELQNLVYGELDSIILKDLDGYTLWNEYIELILNLIEKQSKEIEELKEKNKTLKNLQNDTNRLYTEMIERKNYFERELQKLEDKIKAKIEELKQEKSEYEDTPEWELFDYLEGQIEVLQSLLEKE